MKSLENEGEMTEDKKKLMRQFTVGNKIIYNP